MNQANEITILLSDEALTFVHSLPEKAQKKIAFNIRKVQAGILDNELLKKLNENIWELRTSYNGICYRLLAFWDTNRDALIIATHGFIKKTWKVPEKEIAHAERIRKQYFMN